MLAWLCPSFRFCLDAVSGSKNITENIADKQNNNNNNNPFTYNVISPLPLKIFPARFPCLFLFTPWSEDMSESF